MVQHTDFSPLRALRRVATQESTAGALALIAAAGGLLWANSPSRRAYEALARHRIGPSLLHLHLDLATWASDGLLALFFLVVGLELKHEIVAGSLRNIRQAAVPVVAAVGGMILPAVVFTGVVTTLGARSAIQGWAIPTATDIAFALAILALFGKGLPRALRSFLLTLAVVDDLLAIVVIAVFYTHGIALLPLVAALACVAAFALAIRSRSPRWWVLLPLGLAAWGFMHASGVHATIAGVLLGLTVPARPRHDEAIARTVHLDHILRPVSSGFALPVFAFFAAGVSLAGSGGAREVLGSPVVVAVVLGLVVGKPVGVLLSTWLVTRFTTLALPGSISMRDLVPVGLLTGIGFTVSLLIAELSFPDDQQAGGARVAVLVGTVTSAVLASILLRRDARTRSLPAEEPGTPSPGVSGTAAPEGNRPS